MSELLKIVLSLSLSGTLLFFIILALKPLYKNKLSKRWQYYVWLIVVVRMLTPFTPETTLVGSAFQHLENINVETIQTTPSTNDTQADFDSDERDVLPNGQPQEPQSNMDIAPSISIQAIISKVYENLWILWAAIAFALLIRKITMYQSFIRFVKAGRAEVADIEILNRLADIGEMVGVKRPVELYTNPLISSPMLLGFFHPYIILPSIELDSTELDYIMRHELTHFKHLDMFYKWLVQITVCLHWFNPFAYLMAKEINKCCELSCDEVIIRTLDKDEKKAYGDTLLNSLKAMGNYNDKLATVTLTEGAEQLKERLDAIMKFKKKSRVIVAITLALTTMLCVGATAVGAYAAPKIAIPKTPETINTSNKADISYDKDYAKWNVTHVDDTYYYQNEPVRIFMDLRVDNSFANFSYNENGNIDLRLVRNANDSIVKVEYMSKAEADEILSDLEQNPTAKEDIKRQTLGEVPDAIQSAVSSCDDKTWYVIDGGGRQYIYYNNLQHNYAYQYEPKQNSLKIVDIGKSTGNYVLLSIPQSSSLTISYNSQIVTYTNVTVSPSSTTTNDFFGTGWDEEWNEFDKAFSNEKGNSVPNKLNVKLINTKQWALSGIAKIEVAYVTDEVNLLSSPTQEIILKEYLTEDSPSYHANTSIVDSTLKIERGERPAPSPTGYISNIEIYVPANFSGEIKLGTKSGCIVVTDYKGKLNCNTETGVITILDSKIDGALSSDSGNIECTRTGIATNKGKLNCNTDTGLIVFSDSALSGTLKTNSGIIELGITNLLGDVDAHSETGGIIANISKSAHFSIQAETNTGTVSNKFSDTFTTSNRFVTGEWNTTSTNKINLTSDSGNIEINRK